MIANLNNLITYPRQGILSQDIVKNKQLSVTLFCMAKNTEISEHTSSKQGIVYVIEGNGFFTLAGKEIKMTPGIFIHLPKNTAHSLQANENTSFILLLTAA